MFLLLFLNLCSLKAAACRQVFSTSTNSQTCNLGKSALQASTKGAGTKALLIIIVLFFFFIVTNGSDHIIVWSSDDSLLARRPVHEASAKLQKERMRKTFFEGAVQQPSTVAAFNIQVDEEVANSSPRFGHMVIDVSYSLGREALSLTYHVILFNNGVNHRVLERGILQFVTKDICLCDYKIFGIDLITPSRDRAEVKPVQVDCE
ncbi:hypothetical protein VTN49DRAFT_7626 [Thermomyces lanuginosus]|uniref:uncharacterized protein n=1 Tax=Thermomyces lanuginosus TaxID=5541 RepID=UPI0037422544